MLKSDPLYYLIEVGQYQSLTVAAEKLHVTQPALSLAIKNLENELNLKLLDRAYNGVTLTPEGKKVVELAQKAFAYFKEIENLSHSSQQKNPMSISVYSTQALNASLMPHLIDLYYSKNSGSFQLFPLSNTKPEEILQKHPDAFVLGIFNEARTFSEQINAIVLDKSYSYLAMNEDAPFLAADIKSISVKDLVHIPLVMTIVPEEQSFQNELLATIRKYGEPNIRFVAHDMNLSPSLVAQNIGATLFTLFKQLSPSVTHPNYRLVRIKNTPKFVFSLLYNKEMPKEKVDFFLDLLKQ